MGGSSSSGQSSGFGGGGTAFLPSGSSGMATQTGFESAGTPQPPGQLGGGNMLTSTPPTSAGTMQPLVGAMGQSGGHVTMPFGGQPQPQVGPPTQPGPAMANPPTQPGPSQPMPPSGPMSLFGGGQRDQLQEIIQRLMQGGGNA